MNEQPMNVRDTLHGIGIRASVLAVVGLVLLLTAAGFARYEARQLRRRVG